MDSHKITDIQDSEISSDEEIDNFNSSISSTCFSRLSKLSSLKPATLKSNTPIPTCGGSTSVSRRGSETSADTVTSQTTNESILKSTKSNSKPSVNACFSSAINVREYDKHDSSESVGVSENGESPYEPVNFKLDRYGRILKIKDLRENSSYLEKHLSNLQEESSHLQEHTSRLQLQISNQNLNSQNSNTLKKLAKSLNKTKSKPEKKVNITNLNLSTHIEGTVSSLQIFNKQIVMFGFLRITGKLFKKLLLFKFKVQFQTCQRKIVD